MRKNALRNERGFTLIEIIAVLVILGILAAVAIPKYMDVQKEARNRAMKGALAEGMSTVNMAYAKLMLSAGSVGTTALVAKANANKPASTDFSYAFSLSGSDVLVQVTAKSDGAVAGGDAQQKTWTTP
jgi:MSHA pilin protein MshA